MSPSRHPLRVISRGAPPCACLSRLLILSLLLSVFLIPLPASAADIASAGTSLTGQPAHQRASGPADGSPSESWLITWDASTDGSGTNGSRRVTRQSHVTASIVVNYYSDGSSEYYANEYTATYSVDYLDDYNCDTGGHFHYHYRTEITDPTRYDGIGPVTPNTVMPYRPTPWVGTRWTLNALNLELGGVDSYVLEDQTNCDGEREHYYETSVAPLYVEKLTSYVRTMLNSDNGPLFLYDVDTQLEEEEYTVPYQLHLMEHVRVERLGGHDLRVRDIEVTQGLQLHNTIPLVQGRRTVVRAYIDIGTYAGPVAGVTGRLRAYDGTTLLGELGPFNMAGSISAKRSPEWRQIDDTLNFELPWLWTQAPSLGLQVEVNPTHEISEIRYDNNTSSVQLPLRDCKLLKIAYLPIRFAPPGWIPTSPDADIAVGHEFMRKVYPVADDELLYEPWPGMTWDLPIDGATDKELDTNSTNLLDALSIMISFNNRPAVDRLVGWLPADASETVNGEADAIPGAVAWVAQNKSPNYWRGTFAHEVGHTEGLKHNKLTTSGYHWFDVYERAIKPPRADGNLLDFIGVPGVPEEDRWVSPDSYRALYDEFCPSGGAPQGALAQGTGQPEALGAAPAAADLLVVSGKVGLTAIQSGQLQPLYHTAGTELIPPAGWSYFVVLKNGSTELAKYGFDANLEVEATKPFTPTIAPFALAVPYPAGLNRVDLTDRNGKVLSSRVTSAHPPTVTVQFPNAAGLTLDGMQTIQWTGSDPDGDPLTYSVLYSTDNGATWNAIGANIEATSYAADFAAIPGSATALIKVLATDGFDTGMDVSDQPFTVPGKEPVAVIVSPPAGARFKAGEQIKLQGYGVDLEEGAIPSGSLSWSSDRDGALGAGGLREVTLSEGTHTITLSLAGSAASAATTVVVQAAPMPPPKRYLYLPAVVR